MTDPKDKKKRTTFLFTEIRVVSAWQFTVTSGGPSTKRVVFSALRKHIGMDPKKKDWVLEKGFQYEL